MELVHCLSGVFVTNTRENCGPSSCCVANKFYFKQYSCSLLRFFCRVVNSLQLCVI